MALRDTLLERSMPFLEEGEQPRQAIPVQTGLSPYLLIAGILFWPLLLIVLLSWRSRIVVVTDRATALLESGKFSPYKPKGLLQRVPPNALHGEVDGVIYGKVELAGERYRVHRRFFADVRAAEGLAPDSPLPASPPNQAPPPPAAAPPVGPPPLQADAPAELTGLRVECEGRTQVFAPGAVVTIGRDDDASITCPHPAVSRSHAVLRSEGGVWTLRDSGSRNGTYVDGHRVTTVEIEAPTVVLLGNPQHGGRVDLALVAAPPPPPAPEAAVRPVADQPPADALQPAPVPTQEPLRVRCAGHDYEFPPGASFTIGRDESCDVHADNPLVSRVHARVSTADARWVLEDAGSSRGVFWDGRKVATQRLGGAMTVWLGPEGSGQEVLLVTSGDVPRSLPERIAAGASRGKFVVAALGAAGVALVVALVVALGGGGGGGGEQADLSRLRKATVQIAAYTREGGDLARAWTGSGTVVSADGLILTNAHVAAPTAPGQGVDQGSPVSDEKPAELRVLMNEGDDRPAKEKYVAKVVAADGYLDLAVIRIVSTVDGTAVNPSDLDLENVDVGDSDDVTSGDEVTVLGYPGVAESAGVNVTRGVIGSRVPDQLHRVKGQPLQINIDAQIHGGNSGGLAADRDGRIVGVPTQFNPEIRGGQVVGTINRIRPVNLAKPLIDAAEHRRTYDSHRYVLPLTGDEDFAGVGIGNTADSCSDSTFDTFRSSPSVVLAAFDYSGMTDGLDVYVAIYSVVNGEIDERQAREALAWSGGASGCYRFEIPVDGLASGDYQVAVFVGPNYEEVVGVLPFAVA